MPVSGAKNSALKLMAATLLAPGKTTLQNVPDISDVHVMGKVLKGMGATIEVLDEHTLEIDTSQVDSWEAPYELVAKMRASTAVMGPLLGRFHRAKIAMPGGCNLGARKIDMHILGLEALGVEFDTAHGYINANAPQGLSGTTVTLEFASVGATENLIMVVLVYCRSPNVQYGRCRILGRNGAQEHFCLCFAEVGDIFVVFLYRSLLLLYALSLFTPLICIIDAKDNQRNNRNGGNGANDDCLNPLAHLNA